MAASINNYELETRFCRCGCGKSWRCLPSSTSRHALRSHNPERLNPWRVERNPYREVKKWLVETCGEIEDVETNSDQDLIENIKD